MLNVAGGVVSQVLPDSRVAVFHTRTSAARDFGRIELVSLDSSKRDVLPVFGYEPRIVAGRYLLFVRSGNLMVAPIDIGRRKVLAEPVLAAAGIATDSIMGWRAIRGVRERAHRVRAGSGSGAGEARGGGSVRPGAGPARA